MLFRSTSITSLSSSLSLSLSLTLFHSLSPYFLQLSLCHSLFAFVFPSQDALVIAISIEAAAPLPLSTGSLSKKGLGQESEVVLILGRAPRNELTTRVGAPPAARSTPTLGPLG